MSENKIIPVVWDLVGSLSLNLSRVSFLFFLFLSGFGYFGTVHWFFELASHFKLQYLFASCAFAILFAGLRLWRWALAALCCALVLSSTILPWYLPKSSAPKSDSTQTVRLLLSNVLFKNTRYDAFIDLVREENPDLIFVQEVTSGWAATLERVRDVYPHGIIGSVDNTGGIAALSRLPLVKAGDAGFQHFNGPSLEIELNVGNQPVHIITSHPPPPSGDLNVTMWSPYYMRLVERIGLVNAQEGFGIVATWPTDRPWMKIPIDHCLVSPDIRVVNIRTGRHIGSDHLPLIVELAIPTRK